ncbi:MAG TPA: DUF3800 domain-containing protein [Ardenticatenaceae bacterium]|jgi:hypothetical protein
MEIIFLDESGFTGVDLFDLEQPVFNLASLNCTEEEAQELKGRHFGKVRTRELKHSSLARRPAQQQMVINFLEEMALSPARVKLSVTHKRYALLAKIVDYVFEPVAYEDGLDLYEGGANIALVNLLFFTLPVFGGEMFFEQLLYNFQQLVRLKTEEAYNNFFRPLFEGDFSPELNELLGYFRIGHLRLGHEVIELIRSQHLDIAASCALALMMNWRRELEGPITLVHDTSSNMAQWKPVWDLLTSADLPPAIVGHDRRKMEFPLYIEKTVFESSEAWAGLQLADVLAGAMTRVARWMLEGQSADDTYSRSLSEIVLPNFVSNTIWPQQKVSAEELGTTGESADDTIEYLSKVFRDADIGF